MEKKQPFTDRSWRSTSELGPEWFTNEDWRRKRGGIFRSLASRELRYLHATGQADRWRGAGPDGRGCFRWRLTPEYVGVGRANLYKHYARRMAAIRAAKGQDTPDAGAGGLRGSNGYPMLDSVMVKAKDPKVIGRPKPTAGP